MVIEPTAMITILALALLGTGVVLYMLPVGTCPECAHCKLARAQRAMEQEERSARYYGIPLCPACRRHHDPREDHPA
jgi:hypothetical protein